MYKIVETKSKKKKGVIVDIESLLYKVETLSDKMQQIFDEHVIGNKACYTDGNLSITIEDLWEQT